MCIYILRLNKINNLLYQYILDAVLEQFNIDEKLKYVTGSKFILRTF